MDHHLVDPHDFAALDDDGRLEALIRHAVDCGLKPVIIERLGTCGDIKVNEKIQLLDEDGEVAPGLYAGGSDAGTLRSG